MNFEDVFTVVVRLIRVYLIKNGNRPDAPPTFQFTQIEDALGIDEDARRHILGGTQVVGLFTMTATTITLTQPMYDKYFPVN